MHTPFKYLLLVSISFLLGISGLAQEDSLQVVTSDLTDAPTIMDEDSEKYHSPKKATILAAVLPSAGQFYNKKYWKMPLVYVGFGISLYYLDRNLGDIKFTRENLLAETDMDPSTINITGLSATELASDLNASKRLRDLSYFAIAGVYILQIVDANVDAHLWHFDVSDDLSITAMPSILFVDKTTPGISLSLNF